MKLSEVAEVSSRVAVTTKRLEKRELLAGLLSRTALADVAIVVTYLAGELRQRRTGVGWASLSELPEPADEPTLEVQQVDAALEKIAGLSGAGSASARRAAVAELFGAATTAEQRLLRGLISGEVRQGALDAAVIDAIAQACDIPATEIRRAVMLRGATAPVAEIAFAEGRAAVVAVTAQVGQPVRPMLASSAPDVAAGFDKLDRAQVCVDSKLDGIRIQAHKYRGADGRPVVRLFTRSLDEVTERLADIVELVADVPAEEVILDGEVLAVDESGKPQLFQDTASSTAGGTSGDGTRLAASFFDLLWLDGESLIDVPLRDRLDRLDGLLPAEQLTDRVITADPAAAGEFFDRVVAAGLEGVVLKSLDAPYQAGRRGASWVKVKPRHTLDLVVLAVERGSGRRRGWLSNIHLGARDPATGGFVMLGKTFKGMTDEILRWQTERFTELQTADDGWVVTVKPEQVVEIAFDGVQRSTRYPGGVALRFARVLRYRDDKSADEADTIDAVRQLSAR